MSLRRLGVEQIDLFQLHRIDPKVPAEDQFALLAQLRDEGKVRHVGLSEVTVGDIKAASEVVPIVTVQNLYNLSTRGSAGRPRLLPGAHHRLHPVVPDRER